MSRPHETNRRATGAQVAGRQVPSRRSLLRAVGLAGMAAPMLAACATSAPTPTTGSSAPVGEVDPENPFGLSAGELDVVVFDGGSGVDYLDTVQDLFATRHGDTTITVDKTQDLSPLQSRFVNQNPPDVFQNSGAKALDATVLAANGQLSVLEDLMAAPSWDDPSITVEESLGLGVRPAGTIDGTLVSFNFVQYAWGFWHDATLFADKGWELPDSWESRMELFATIKADGIAPLAFTGVHTNYPESGLFHPLVAKFGGQEVWKHVDNLEDGAWQQDAIRQAAEALLQLRKDDYILRGVAQMTHLQSQTAWLDHQAAFIPVGAWLENEMRSTIGKDFQLTATAIPGPGGNLNDLTPNNAGAAWLVPTQGANVPAAKELLRALVSKEAARTYAELTNSVTVVKGAHDDQDLGPAFESISTMITKSDAQEPWTPIEYNNWYKSLSTEVGAALLALLVGDATVEDFLGRCQRKADQVKGDRKIKKFTR